MLEAPCLSTIDWYRKSWICLTEKEGAEFASEDQKLEHKKDIEAWGAKRETESETEREKEK